jgi:hypothetical protein
MEDKKHLRILPLTFEFLHTFLELENTTKICAVQYDIKTNTVNFLIEDSRFAPIHDAGNIPIISRVSRIDGRVFLEG